VGIWEAILFPAFFVLLSIKKQRARDDDILLSHLNPPAEFGFILLVYGPDESILVALLS
jgi:hypothetical protein